MTILLSLVLISVGVAILMNTLIGAGFPAPAFPRPGVPAPSRRMLLPIALGVAIALAGVAIWLLAPVQPPL